ncbi:MAG: DUF2911 domain-containing protein [Saprospiraceae bacterium]
MRKQLFAFCLPLFALLFLTATPVAAQINTPAPSPGGKIMQTVGLTDVTVEYSRPSAKNRTLFAADGLVPYGEVWRTGANQATKITFSDDVMVDGKEVPAGSYAILTKPMEKAWEVMFFPYESGNWSSYVEKDPALTVTAPVKKNAMKVESFTINIGELSTDAAHLEMYWGNTMVAVPMKVEVDGRVKADIDRVMAGPSVNDYYSAASYLSDANQDMNKALMYIKKANEMSKDAPKFWMLRRESLIQAALGNTKEAITAAEMSMKLAEAAGNQDYVRMNRASLMEWKKK